MGRVWKIITMLIVCGGHLDTASAVCQAETATEKNTESDYTFDEKTGTLIFYGRGMLGIFPALEKIRISGQNTIYQMKNNVVFSKNGKKLYYYPIARKGKFYRVPNSEKKIEFHAFYENQTLQHIYAGKNTTTIGSNAFYNAKKLSLVELGKNCELWRIEPFLAVANGNAEE